MNPTTVLAGFGWILFFASRWTFDWLRYVALGLWIAAIVAFFSPWVVPLCQR